jgi:uncharacterized phage-like protein YoqJ
MGRQIINKKGCEKWKIKFVQYPAQAKHFDFGYNEKHKRCIELKDILRQLILKVYRGAHRQFYVGGGQGVDMWCAEIILELQQE